MYTVIVKSPALNNTLLAISKRINDDKTITYVGRIINDKYADGYELKKEQNGSYAMNKNKNRCPGGGLLIHQNRFPKNGNNPKFTYHEKDSICHFNPNAFGLI